MVENKIVTLANSFTEMYDLKSSKSSSKISSKISPVEYKKTYIDALSAYQNGDYNKAINGFSGLVLSDPNNDLACLLYTSPSPRDRQKSRMPSSA